MVKICMLGAGSMGSTFGGVLTEAGEDVYLLDSWKEHVETINRHGLKISEDTSERIVKARATTDCREIGPVDLVIVFVKSFDTKESMESNLPLIGDNTMVLSLQNGLGNEETLENIVGREHLIGGRTLVGGVLTAPGEVLIGRKGKLTSIGELNGETTERISLVADVFNKAGLETAISDNIYTYMWSKLLINIATAALSGITGLTFGEFKQVEEMIECSGDAVSEAIAVAKAEGVELSVDDPKEVFYNAIKGLPFDFKASILQSLEKGSVSEIDYIHGPVVRLGKKYGIPTPVNKTLVAGIKGVEFKLKKA
jgi:2-dehydropantoate 2-reductase